MQNFNLSNTFGITQVSLEKYAMLKKLKDVVCKNTLYPLKDSEIAQWPSILGLQCAHGNALLFVFSEFHHKIMPTLEAEKPVPAMVEVISIEYAGPTRVGRVTPTPAKLQDHSIVIGASSMDPSTAYKERKHTMVTSEARKSNCTSLSATIAGLPDTRPREKLKKLKYELIMGPRIHLI